MLLALLYHQIGDGSKQLPPAFFKEHLEKLAKKYPIVTPNALGSRKNFRLCLSFDDATCDFYFYVFPLLKKLGIKALLAVSPSYITDKAHLDQKTRLSFLKDLWNTPSKEAFCTWEEIREMHESSFVEIASHSLTHADMTDKTTDLEKELFLSKHLLQEKLQTKVETFIYPYGKWSQSVHVKVLEHYSKAMRISSALNLFPSKQHLLYRIPISTIETANKALSPLRSWGYLAKYFTNLLRKS